MKKFCYQLIASSLVILLSTLYLKQYGTVYPSIQGPLFPAGILKTCLLAGTGMLIGLILLLPDILSMKNRKLRPYFQWSVFFGQGILALLLFINQPIIRWLIRNDFMKEPFPGLIGYPIAVSLLGSFWLGIVLVNTFKPNSDLFHMKQRRRGR